MDPSAVDMLLGDLLGRCHSACQTADQATESAVGSQPSTERCTQQLLQVAQTIKGIEDELARIFLPDLPSPGPGANPNPPFGSAFSSRVPSWTPSPPPVPVPPELLPLRAAYSAEEADLLIHDIRGIRTVFSIGAELKLEPQHMAPLVVGAGQTVRRLEPILRDFAAVLRSRLT
jgi:hypothetical protein